MQKTCLLKKNNPYLVSGFSDKWWTDKYYLVIYREVPKYPIKPPGLITLKFITDQTSQGSLYAVEVGDIEYNVERIKTTESLANLIKPSNLIKPYL